MPALLFKSMYRFVPQGGGQNKWGYMYPVYPVAAPPMHGVGLGHISKWLQSGLVLLSARLDIAYT